MAWLRRYLSREEIFENIRLLYDLSSGMCHPDGEIWINHRIRLNLQKKAALNVIQGYLQDYRVVFVKIAQRWEIRLPLDVA